MSIPFKTIVAFFAFSLTLMLVVLSVHLWPGNNSMLNLHTWPHEVDANGISEKYVEEVLVYHETEPTFARRVITTKFVRFFSNAFGLSLGISFTLFNFGMLLLTGFCICLLALKTTQNVRFAFLSGLLFWLSFPIMFAFFPTIYSYDDPLQYLFITLTLLAFIDKNYTFAAGFFTLSLFVRESGLLLLPGIFILLNSDFTIQSIKENARKWAPFFVLSFIFIVGKIVAQYFIQDGNFTSDAEDRFAVFAFNFQDKQFAIETLFSFTLVSLLALITFLKEPPSKWKNAFFATLILNTIIVVLFTQARESRLFLLPLFFWFPLAGKYFWNALSQVKNAFAASTLKMSFSAGAAIFIAYALAYNVYVPTAMQLHENWHNEYLFILLTFVLVLHSPFLKTSSKNG